MTARTGVLFVCLGNICRSPLAEGIFIHRARQRGILDRFDIDSCGTGGWHIGERADPRSIAVAAKHGIELPSIGRQLCPKRDRDRFHWLIAMDRSNRRELLAAGFDESRVRLIRSFDPTLAASPTLFGGDPGPERDVPDPYHWCGDGFENVYQMLDRSCAGLLDFLTK